MLSLTEHRARFAAGRRAALPTHDCLPRQLAEEMAVARGALSRIAALVAAADEVGSLPAPSSVRAYLAARHSREAVFGPALFADPAWEMLLELYASERERREISVSGLCVISGVPPTTALRWIARLLAAGLVVRHRDAQDRRRSWVTFSIAGRVAMASYVSRFAATWPGRQAI